MYQKNRPRQLSVSELEIADNRLESVMANQSEINFVKTIEEIEENAIKTYLEQINLLPGSGEYAINNVMYPGAWGKYPLCERMQDLKVPMAFFYGDHDWVASDGADKVALKTSAMVQKYIISNSDHHLYWDNPSETVEKMLNAIATLE